MLSDGGAGAGDEVFFGMSRLCRRIAVREEAQSETSRTEQYGTKRVQTVLVLVGCRLLSLEVLRSVVLGPLGCSGVQN